MLSNFAYLEGYGADAGVDVALGFGAHGHHAAGLAQGCFEPVKLSVAFLFFVFVFGGKVENRMEEKIGGGGGSSSRHRNKEPAATAERGGTAFRTPSEVDTAHRQYPRKPDHNARRLQRLTKQTVVGMSRARGSNLCHLCPAWACLAGTHAESTLKGYLCSDAGK